MLAQPGVERRQLLVRVLHVEPAVAPVDGVFVVGSDLGRQLRDAVLGLGHVVEAGVVHDRTGRPVRCGVALRAERIHRHGVRSPEIVLQSEAVPQLVRRDEAHGIAHHLRRQRVAARCGVHGAGLEADPGVENAHHVVPPDDVGLDDLAAPGVDHRRAHGVGHLRGGVGHHRVAHVVDVELPVVGGDLPCYDGVLEACGLEGLLPLDDAFLDVGNPYGRGRRVDPQLDRLLRFDQFAFLVTLHVLGFRLQPPAVDERAFLGLLLFVVEVEVSDLEIAHAVVGEPRSHRLPGEQHQVRGDFHGQGDRRALLGVRGREERFDDDVFGERLDGFDLRKVLLGRTGQSDGAENVVETLFAAVEDLVDLDDHRCRILAVGIDRELLDRRFAVVVPYGAGDAVAFGRGDARVVGHDPYLFIKGVLAETHNLLAVAHAFVDARVVQGVGNARNLVDDQYVAAHQRVGNLEQEVGSLAVHVEHALVGHGAFQQFFVPFLLFFGRVGLLGRGFGFLQLAARLALRFGRRGRQQEERRQRKHAPDQSSLVHRLLLQLSRESVKSAGCNNKI